MPEHNTQRRAAAGTPTLQARQRAECGTAAGNVLLLTLQFARSLHRDALLASLCKGMSETGCLGERSPLDHVYIKNGPRAERLGFSSRARENSRT